MIEILLWVALVVALPFIFKWAMNLGWAAGNQMWLSGLPDKAPGELTHSKARAIYWPKKWAWDMKPPGWGQ